ncbi:GNAT family N-acetyltransferase [Primorskyibacter sp. S187A]|uniref:GNAT family N-acetyltransferase n=1 Tax=Primorskyibacter sp. S187A TaxID=3415130 RepID=UPI003C7E26EA
MKPDLVTLRAATDADRELVLRLEEEGMRAYAQALWGNWHPSATTASLDLAGHEMITVGGKIVGVIQTKDHGQSLQVAKLYIASDARGMGFGAAAIWQKVGAEDRSIWLNVLTTNPDARRFYERLGFSVREETPERWCLQLKPSAVSPNLNAIFT